MAARYTMPPFPHTVRAGWPPSIGIPEFTDHITRLSACPLSDGDTVAPWGRAGSLIFAGAGVSRGKVIGATDKNGAFVTDRPVRPADVCWTIYESLGIDPTKELLTPEGRPVSILAEGATVGQGSPSTATSPSPRCAPPSQGTRLDALRPA